MLDNSCGFELERHDVLVPEGALCILATANEQLFVVDDRLSPDVLADRFWQLDDTFLLAPRELFAIPEVDVDLRDINPISLQQRPERQLCLRITDESRQLLRARHEENMFLLRVVGIVVQDIVVERLATAECRDGLHLSEIGISLCVVC